MAALAIPQPTPEMLKAGHAAMRRSPGDPTAVFMAMLATSDLWPAWLVGYDCIIGAENEAARRALLASLT
jgi:hypothetical protein